MDLAVPVTPGAGGAYGSIVAVRPVATGMENIFVLQHSATHLVNLSPEFSAATNEPSGTKLVIAA
jgi:FlaA1/EpsC-like NDP-sugar epimerase